jgi:hypothetical protein
MNLQPTTHRFVYCGPAGSHTPLHRDVMCSHSWSANVCGHKRWWLLHPTLTPLLYDCLGNTLAPHFFADRDGSSPSTSPWFAGLARARQHMVVVEQLPGEAIFVPSGWYHCVENVDPCLSVNTNWLNGTNVAAATAHVLGRLRWSHRHDTRRAADGARAGLRRSGGWSVRSWRPSRGRMAPGGAVAHEAWLLRRVVTQRAHRELDEIDQLRRRQQPPPPPPPPQQQQVQQQAQQQQQHQQLGKSRWLYSRGGEDGSCDQHSRCCEEDAAARMRVFNLQACVECLSAFDRLAQEQRRQDGALTGHEQDEENECGELVKRLEEALSSLQIRA